MCTHWISLHYLAVFTKKEKVIKKEAVRTGDYYYYYYSIPTPSFLYVTKCKINLTFKLEIIRGKFQTELSLCHKLWFFNPCIISIRCCRRLIFQTINSVRSNSLSLKYQRLTPSGYRDIRIIKFKWRKLNSFQTKLRFSNEEWK